ncbi:MAG: hypothetical protein ACREBJ_04250 [Nitrosotalea sp.]
MTKIKTEIAFAKTELKNMQEQLDEFYKLHTKALKQFGETLDLMEKDCHG